MGADDRKEKLTVRKACAFSPTPYSPGRADIEVRLTIMATSFNHAYVMKFHHMKRLSSEIPERKLSTWRIPEGWFAPFPTFLTYAYLHLYSFIYYY